METSQEKMARPLQVILDICQEKIWSENTAIYYLLTENNHACLELWSKEKKVSFKKNYRPKHLYVILDY